MQVLIERKIRAALTISSLTIIDESLEHAGHSGVRQSGFTPGKSTHFRIMIRSPDFNNLSRVEISRKIHQILREELANHIHALAIDARGTGES